MSDVNNISDRIVYLGDKKNALKSVELASLFEGIRPDSSYYREVCTTALYRFSNKDDQLLFEKILKNNNIPYTNKLPDVAESEIKQTNLSSKKRFNNSSSMVGFVKGYESVDDVIEADSKDLKKIGGSFEDIGDRMSYLISQVEEILSPKRDTQREQIFKKYGYKSDDYWNIPNHFRQKIEQEIHALYNNPILIPGENRIELVELISTRGFQSCPFEQCEDGASSKDYVIRNTHTGKQLLINPMTVHLASRHHLLEKGNDYGITAAEFYAHFMKR